MRHLLLLYFFVAGAQAAYGVVFKNNCANSVTVSKTGGNGANILLSAGQTKIDGNVLSVTYKEPGTVTMFRLSADGSVNSASLSLRGTARSAKLVPRCPNCPVLWCEMDGCKKTGDASFSNSVNVDVPASTTFDITYCY